MSLKELREDCGWSQDDLATEAGVSRTTITMLETGYRTNPGLDLLRQIAAAFDMTVVALLKEMES